jgi:hypothetical protein
VYTPRQFFASSRAADLDLPVLNPSVPSACRHSHSHANDSIANRRTQAHLRAAASVNRDGPGRQARSSLGRSISCMMSRMAAAIGIATSAPMIPKITPPSSIATTVTTEGTSTTLPMIFGNSR